MDKTKRKSNKKSLHNRSTAFTFSSNLKQYSISVVLVILSTSAFYLIKGFIGYQVVSFLLLFLVSILALFFNTGPILVAAILSALIWDIFFIPPQFTIHIENPVDLLMLIMFFTVALVNGIYTSRVRRQEQHVRNREEQTNALYQLTKDLNAISGFSEVVAISQTYIQKYFKLPSAIFLKKEGDALDINSNAMELTDNEKVLAYQVFRTSNIVGKYTLTQESEKYTFYTLQGNNGNMGVVVIEPQVSFSFSEEQFWNACLSQIAGKLEREFLREEAKKNYLVSESEKLYKTLFNSISHELRIPVAAIMGATDTLLSQEYPEDIRGKLLHEINTASIRLNRLIENLLNMSRLESGRIKPHVDWCDVNDLAYNVSESLGNELQNYNLVINIPQDMPLVRIDYGLIEQVIHNLILNAIQYSQPSANIILDFLCEKNILNIQIRDFGLGFPPSELSLVFKKFYRGRGAKAGGTGLGLSIVKGFVEAHKGTVTAENANDGGAIIRIKIPVETSELSTFDHINSREE